MDAQSKPSRSQLFIFSKMFQIILFILPILIAGPSANALNCTLKNEFLNPCPGPCIPGKYVTCLQFLNNEYVECDPNYPIPKKCVPTCECYDGFIRSLDGDCVRQSQCCTEPNTELVECADACPKTCGNFETWRSNECLRPCKTRECMCKDGFIQSYGGKSKCVLPADCNGSCPKGQILDSCVPCPPGVPCPKICREECVCKENEQKSKTSGKCCPPKKLCGKNEIFGINNCDATCEDPNLICFLRNRLGCFCRKGHVRNKKGSCVKVETCPNSCDKNLNEVFRRDGKDGTCNNPELKFASVEAKYGCFCPEGYLRSHQNVCVLPEDCKKCGPNEEYRQSLFDVRCKDALNPTQDPNYYDCYCKAGYARDDENNCVLIENCPNDCKEGEIYRLGNCQGTCKNPSTENCLAPDRFDCFCRNEFLRDSNNVCIRQALCVKPKPPKCKKDEVLNICPEYCSIEKSCATEFEGGGLVCIPEHEGYVCSPRCECKKGLLRLNGKCVKPQKCCKDPNEVPAKCPQPCEPTCFTMPDSECKKDKCYENTCICRKGYIRRSETDSTCIRKSECGDPNDCH